MQQVFLHNSRRYNAGGPLQCQVMTADKANINTNGGSLSIARLVGRHCLLNAQSSVPKSRQASASDTGRYCALMLCLLLCCAALCCAVLCCAVLLCMTLLGALKPWPAPALAASHGFLFQKCTALPRQTPSRPHLPCCAWTCTEHHQKLSWTSSRSQALVDAQGCAGLLLLLMVR